MGLFLTLINLILNQLDVCFCCRYILGNRKLKKATFQFTPNYEHEDRRHKWRHLVEKYGLDRIKGHLVKVSWLLHQVVKVSTCFDLLGDEEAAANRA